MRPLAKKDPESLGGYALIGRLGAGGMGVVYLASKGSESVALKVVRDSLIEDDAQLARFKREIETLESINHPNIARILDSGVDEDQAWFAAEFANGPDLSARVKDKGPLDEDEWWTLAEGLMSALAAVHAAGVIHRDVKPSNVILTEAGPKLIDFGIAHVSDATSVTSTGMVAGSPAWFSPEQIEGFELTSATDVFSAGSVLTFAATGSSPWGNETTMTKASVFKILTNEPDISGVDGLSRQYLASLLMKEPSDRPPADRAATAASERNLDLFGPNPGGAGSSTRLVSREGLAQSLSVTNPGTAGQKSREKNTPPAADHPPAKRLGIKSLAAILIPLLALGGLVVARQSEAQGDLRVVVRVNEQNPIVGSASVTLSSESSNPVTVEFTDRTTQNKVLRWSSWESIRLTYDPPFAEDEGFEETFQPQDLRLTGFDSGKDLSLRVVLQSEAAVLQFVDSENSVIRSVRLKRGNETKALQTCNDAVSRTIDRDVRPYKGLWAAYEGSEADAQLDGYRSMTYTRWASRVSTLLTLMSQDEATAVAASGPVSSESQRLVTNILDAHAGLSLAWQGLRQSASSGGTNWDESWDAIYDAQRRLRSSTGLSPSTVDSVASAACKEQIS